MKRWRIVGGIEQPAQPLPRRVLEVLEHNVSADNGDGLNLSHAFGGVSGSKIKITSLLPSLLPAGHTQIVKLFRGDQEISRNYLTCGMITVTQAEAYHYGLRILALFAVAGLLVLLFEGVLGSGIDFSSAGAYVAGALVYGFWRTELRRTAMSMGL